MFLIKVLKKTKLYCNAFKSRKDKLLIENLKFSKFTKIRLWRQKVNDKKINRSFGTTFLLIFERVSNGACLRCLFVQPGLWVLLQGKLFSTKSFKHIINFFRYQNLSKKLFTFTINHLINQNSKNSHKLHAKLLARPSPKTSHWFVCASTRGLHCTSGTSTSKY